MRQMLCVVVYILSSVDHRLKHAAGTCDAALPVIGLVIGLIITGTILVSSAVVLSGILSPHAYIATVRSGLTSIQSSICTLYRHVQNAITSIAMTARCVVQAVDKLRRSIISAFLLSKSATTHFLSRVTSRIRRAPGMLVDILTVSTAQRLLFKFRSVPLIALRIPLAILEVLLSFAVRVGSGEPFFVAGGLVGECLEGVLRLCWRTAVDVCEVRHTWHPGDSARARTDRFYTRA
ncbi:hypothetical protein L226DRAFT_161192 [Lentinus tigrinus ALCF2SS1-7]|uniref:uncharacterized protein n=1 Tax=Lentinus tigrinus ALCF2SS1-7 TaxID=1328758 RepID=UPI001165CC00|nr:hypothetical protein L226DRAFT_161192 [Lentinus tigrinus ALCF2SS1-7]